MQSGVLLLQTTLFNEIAKQMCYLDSHTICLMCEDARELTTQMYMYQSQNGRIQVLPLCLELRGDVQIKTF